MKEVRATTMDIHIRDEPAGSVVEVTGDVDMSSSPKLRDALLALLRDRSASKVVVNLAGVEYIDSSGIASLVEGLQEASRHKARLVLASLQEGPRHVLQLTRLLEVFEVCSTEAEALEA